MKENEGTSGREFCKFSFDFASSHALLFFSLAFPSLTFSFDWFCSAIPIVFFVSIASPQLLEEVSATAASSPSLRLLSSFPDKVFVSYVFIASAASPTRFPSSLQLPQPSLHCHCGFPDEVSAATTSPMRFQQQQLPPIGLRHLCKEYFFFFFFF
ncbi:hypothetical protein NMG60_11007237 [Bertholletia excelsa]